MSSSVRVRKLVVSALCLIGCGLVATPALAVPSFARQTGAPCAACHVGAFGPQLTDFGVQFKLGGYTLSKADAPKIPVAGMVIGSYTRTGKDLPDPLPDHVKANNNLTLDQASLFLAGKLAPSIGVFSQVTFDGIARRLAIDNVDARYATTSSLAGHPVVAGVSVNNSPGLSDPYNALPIWGYPFISSAIAPTPDAGTLLDGALAQHVVGATGYLQLDGTWYGELGTYRSLSITAQSKLGLGHDTDPGVLHNTVYARLAAQHQWGNQSLAGGFVLFNANIQPDRTDPSVLSDRDLGADISYRWLPSDNSTYTVLANIVRERQGRSALANAGTALHADGRVTEYSVTGSYYFQNTYGFSAQRFGLTGDSDSLFYADGYSGGSPNWTGTRLQIDYTPFGKLPLSGPFNPQLRVGLQYTAYDKFNGARRNYDGSGRNASDNNSLFLFAWLLF